MHLVLFNTSMESRQQVEVVKRMLQLFPGSVKEKDASGELPIHYACQYQSNEASLVGLLIDAYPSGLSEVDGYGRLPLHSACDGRGLSDGVIYLLISRYPDAASAIDNKGYLPLHYACEGGCNLVSIKLLLAIKHASILAETNDAKTPLYLAHHPYITRSGATHEVNDFL